MIFFFCELKCKRKIKKMGILCFKRRRETHKFHKYRCGEYSIEYCHHCALKNRKTYEAMRKHTCGCGKTHNIVKMHKQRNDIYENCSKCKGQVLIDSYPLKICSKCQPSCKMCDNREITGEYCSDHQLKEITLKCSKCAKPKTIKVRKLSSSLKQNTVVGIYDPSICDECLRVESKIPETSIYRICNFCEHIHTQGKYCGKKTANCGRKLGFQFNNSANPKVKKEITECDCIK